MKTLKKNLRQDILGLLEKFKNREIRLYEIDSEIPLILQRVLALFNDKDFSPSNFKSLEKQYTVFSTLTPK